MSLGELWLCLDLLHGFFFLDVHCPFSPPLTSRKPYESTYTSTASQTFSDSTQQIIIFLSENHHVRTMSLCIKKKKTSRLEVVQLKLTTCTSPKDISLWLCKSLPPSGRTQRKSTKITSDFCRQCLLLQTVSGVFFKLNNSRKSWYKIPMKSPPSKIHLPFFHDLNKVPAASRILIYSCWHYVGKKGEFNTCS